MADGQRVRRGDPGDMPTARERATMTEVSHDAWTPARGLRRAIATAILATLLMSVALGALAVAAPAILMNGFCRAFITLGVGWVMFGAVHAAGGTVGGVLTWIATIATALVMLSNHAAWAIFGAPVGDGGELVTGWAYWFEPGLVAVLSIFVAAPLTLCVMLCRDGVPGPDLFTYVATLPVWGTRRS